MNQQKNHVQASEENNTFFVREDNKSIFADFGQTLGAVKPLHGINNSPITYGESLPELREAGIPYTRLHDTGGMYGGNRFVNVPNIFRDFDADPNDPASYDFAFTDAYLKGLNASGIKIFYRLGVTIENAFTIRTVRIHPPKDYLKWAKICEGIINHYNNGWADGFHYGIEYWEIWNEPEQPAMWTGTMEEYFEFYKTVAVYLKERFPELKIGGYACSGFCAYCNPEAAKNPKFRSFLTWFDEFLKFAQREQPPFDFFSFHYYPKTVDDIRMNSRYVDEKLQQYGFSSVEVIFNEWNYMDWSIEKRFDAMREMPAASLVAAAFCAMQRLNISKAMYYDAQPNSQYGGMYYFPSCAVSKTYYSFRIFNALYQLGREAVCNTPENDLIYGLAATDGTKCAMMLCNLNGRERLVELKVSGAAGKPECTILDADRIFVRSEILWQKDGSLRLPGQSVILLEWGK